MQEQPNVVSPNTTPPAPTPPVQPIAPIQPISPVPPSTVPTAPEPESKRGWMKWLVIALLALIVFGGAGSAYYFGVAVPNKPNNVVAKAFTKLSAIEDGIKKTTVTVVTQPKSGSTGKVSTTTVFGADKDFNVRADSQVKVSAFDLTFSSLVRTNDKTMYVKVDELPSLLKAAGGEGTPQLEALANKLNGSWIKVSVPDLKAAGLLTKSQSDKATACVDALSTYLSQNKGKLKSSLADAYKQHPFVKAAKVSAETVNNVSATKYQLTIDKTAATEFSKALDSATANDGQAVDKACNGTAPATKPTKTDQAVDQTTLKNTFVWISKDKKLIKLTTDVDSKTTTSAVVVDFGTDAVDTSVPAKVLTIKELKTAVEKAFGASVDEIKGAYGGTTL